MNNKEVVRALLWAALVFFAWQIIAVRIWPPTPKSKPSPTADAGNGTNATTPDQGGLDDRADPSNPSEPDQIASSRKGADDENPAVEFDAADSPQTLIIGDQGKKTYGLTLELSNIGASVVATDLSDFTLTVEKNSPPYPVLTEQDGIDGAIYRSFAVEKVHLRDLKLTVPLADVPWQVERSSDTMVTFKLDIRHENAPLIRLRKTYALTEQSRSPERHDLNVTLEIENLSQTDQTVIVTQFGAVGIRREDPRMDDRSLYIGSFSEGVVRSSSGKLAGGIKKEEVLYTQRSASPPLMWTAVANKYFVVFESFRPASSGGEGGDWIGEVKQTPLMAPDKKNKTVTFRTTTKAIRVGVGETKDFDIDCYLGPKSRKAFRDVKDYVARGYDEQVLASYGAGSCCSFMAFKPLTVFMINMLNWLKVVVFNYGLAIIVLVLIVRTILHPITKKGQVNMMRMQQQMSVLQPKMEEVKKRYANDATKRNQELMKVQQEAGVNPVASISSCLPMFLQMPIWIALYTSLNYNIDMRHQPFFFWIHDLTAPDALVHFSRTFTLPLLGPVTSFNLLPILVSIAMFLQQKLMPKPTAAPSPTQSKEKADQAAQMQKMMPYMTLIFGFFFYNMPSGLNLYIGASSFFGMIEQWRIRKHIEMLKQLPPPPPKTRTEGPTKPKKPKKPSFFQKLQQAAADAEKIKSTRDKQKKRK